MIICCVVKDDIEDNTVAAPDLTDGMPPLDLIGVSVALFWPFADGELYVFASSKRRHFGARLHSQHCSISMKPPPAA